MKSCSLKAALLRVRQGFKACLFGGLFLLGGLAQAITLVPLDRGFTPSGLGSTQTFTVTNTGKQPAAVEITLMSRELDSEGQDILAEADDDFTVFPAQMVLQPAQAQTVRVQYVGPPNLTTERAYRLIAEQLPIDLGDSQQDGGRINVMMKYVASLYVTPAKAKAQFVVSELKAVEDKGATLLEIKLRNDGNAHKVITNGKLYLGSQELKGEQIGPVEGANLLPGGVRVFRIPMPSGSEILGQPARLVSD